MTKAIIVIFLLSFLLALISLRDLKPPKHIRKRLAKKGFWGKIIFLPDKILHIKSWEKK